MARQAAHLFAQLAAALGIKFEPYAITFMGALFKGLVITVQVGGLVGCVLVGGWVGSVVFPDAGTCCSRLSIQGLRRLKQCCAQDLTPLRVEWLSEFVR